jgi:hypothetical protein
MDRTMPRRHKLPELLNRRDAAAHISATFFKIAPATLARKAAEGSGPPYFSVAGQALYAAPDLDAWAVKQLGEARVRFPAPPRTVRKPLGRPRLLSQEPTATESATLQLE